MGQATIREAELSFCFPYEASEGAMDGLLGTLSAALDGTRLTVEGRKPVVDHYIDPSTRLRNNAGRLTIDHKSGEKSGIRDERSSAISPEAFDILSMQARLTVSKERFTVRAAARNGSRAGQAGPLDITIDRVYSPMKVTIVDIECHERHFRFLSEELETIRPLKRNMKSAWHYFTRKVGFCGAPSSGKSAMTRQLVNALSIDYDIVAEQVTEYARTHIARYGTPKWHAQPSIMAGQRRLEQDARHATVLVTDSPTFLGYIYMKHYLDKPLDTESIHMLSQAYADALSSAAEYTDLFLLSPRQPKQDGIRITDLPEMSRLHGEMEKFLVSHRIAHSPCSCTANVHQLVGDMYCINHVPQATAHNRAAMGRTRHV